MKKELESIIENAKCVIELAEGDIECFADDFCADDYRKYLGRIDNALSAADAEHKSVMDRVKRLKTRQND